MGEETKTELMIPAVFESEDGEVWWCEGHITPEAMALAVVVTQMALIGGEAAAQCVLGERGEFGYQIDWRHTASRLLRYVEHWWLRDADGEALIPCEADHPEAEPYTRLYDRG